MRFTFCSALIALVVILNSPSQAQTLAETTIWIQCSTYNSQNGEVTTFRSGSGVLVSERGHILTAKHVVYGGASREPKGLTCQGAVGNAAMARVNLTPVDYSPKYDAVILKHPEIGLPYLAYCNLDRSMKGRDVYALGFPLQGGTPEPSLRRGIISTIYPRNGLIDTDTAFTHGMSGGPVAFADTRELVGLVVGGNSNPKGLPDTYKVLTAEHISDDLGRYMAKGCTKPRMTEIKGGQSWTAGSSASIPLGMMPGEGHCFIVGVWGTFNDPKDSVEIRIDDAEGYVLAGNRGGNGKHGAWAQCVRF